MGVVQNLVLGPYAEFAVPPGRVAEFPPRDEETKDRLGRDDLHCNWGMEGRHDDSYRYMPREDGPGRPMFSSDKHVHLDDQDLTELDRDAEMAWFASTYAGPLRLLSERFGGPPRVRWGLVFWLT